MSQFTNLYNNGQWGFMGIGPMPAYPISMTITAPGEFPSGDSYFTCGAGDNWSILAYLPTDRTKYAVMKNTTLGTIYMAGSVYSPSYRIVSNDPLNYPDIPASVTVDIPTDPDAWDFYGGLTSLEGCALCMWVPDTTGSAPNGCDYVSIGESKKSWFSYEDDREEFAYTIDGNYIYAKRAERDANGNVISSVPASTSADENKVLTVDSNGDAVWATAQGGGSSLPSTTGNAYKVLSVSSDASATEWVLPLRTANYTATFDSTRKIYTLSLSSSSSPLYGVQGYFLAKIEISGSGTPINNLWLLVNESQYDDAETHNIDSFYWNKAIPVFSGSVTLGSSKSIRVVTELVLQKKSSGQVKVHLALSTSPNISDAITSASISYFVTGRLLEKV